MFLKIVSHGFCVYDLNWWLSHIFCLAGFGVPNICRQSMLNLACYNLFMRNFKCLKLSQPFPGLDRWDWIAWKAKRWTWSWIKKGNSSLVPHYLRNQIPSLPLQNSFQLVFSKSSQFYPSFHSCHMHCIRCMTKIQVISY